MTMREAADELAKHISDLNDWPPEFQKEVAKAFLRNAGYKYQLITKGK